jgi:hypothetical protein
MTDLQSTSVPARIPTERPRWPYRVRRFTGGFFLLTAGVHLGIVVADPQFYRTFAEGSPFAFVRDGWTDIVMANPAAWGLLAFAGELLTGLLLLSRGWRVRLGWVLVIAFHCLLLLFGPGFLLWSVPVLAVLVPAARRDWPAVDAGPAWGR